jgi:hypothetical protein
MDPACSEVVKVKEEKTKPIAFAEINLDEITETTTPPRQIQCCYITVNPAMPAP